MTLAMLSDINDDERKRKLGYKGIKLSEYLSMQWHGTRKHKKKIVAYTRHRVMKFMAIFLNLRPKYITASML